MADPTTSNVGLAIPTRGSDVGVWDTPVNNDFIALDGFFGGVQTIGVASTPVTLTSPAAFVPTPGGGPTQSQNAVLRFTGVLGTNVQITLPLPGYYIIENLTTVPHFLTFRAIGSGEIIAVDQGAVQHIYNDGTNVRFVNLPPVGSYLDVCDASIPAWISGCTKPPYLLCDGSAFSAVTYPYLNARLGGTTLPDLRGRARFYLNGGTNRITTAGSGIDGNTVLSSGGAQNISIAMGNLPASPAPVAATTSGYTPTSSGQTVAGVVTGSVTSPYTPSGGNLLFAAGNFGTIAGFASLTVGSNTANLGSGTALNEMPPATISGITLIRAG